MADCSYYTSDDWKEKKAEVLENNNDVRTLIWCSREIDDSEGALSNIIKNTKFSREELGNISKEQFLSEVDNDLVQYSKKIRESHITFLQTPSKCPHDPVESEDRCIFHLEPQERKRLGIEKEQVKTELLNKIKKPGRDTKLFAGAIFEDLDLAQQKISSSDNFPVHFEACEFRGHTSFERSVIDQPFIANGLITEGITFRDTQFNKDAEFRGGLFKDTAKFTYANFKSDAEFWNTEFEAEVSFYASRFDEYAEFRNSHFDKKSNFQYSDVGRDIEFWDSTFFGDVDMRNLLVENAAEFRYSYFDNEALFTNTRVVGDIEFNYSKFNAILNFENTIISGNSYFHSTVFGDYVNFKSCEFGGAVEFNPNYSPEESDGAEFKQGVSFQNSNFNKDAEFWGVNFSGKANFDDCEFKGPSEFHYTSFDGEVSFDKTKHSKIYFIFTKTHQTAIQITNSVINTGTIVKPKNSSVLYDLKRSEIGDIDIHAEDGTNIFSFLRFFRTDFVKFDFSSYREDLNSSWKIHEHTSGGLDIATEADANKYAELEATYLKAKNGAANVGDSKAASEFFMLERTYQRKYQFLQMVNSDSNLKSLKHMYKFGSSWLFNLTCGYGERPFRTVSFGVAVIFIYTLIYQSLLDFRGTESFLKYTTLSIQTFVSFLFGGIQPENKTVLMQFLTSSEAFIGGFTVALFVFALTRSVQR